MVLAGTASGAVIEREFERVGAFASALEGQRVHRAGDDRLRGLRVLRQVGDDHLYA
jgi:hypothetical protein